MGGNDETITSYCNMSNKLLKLLTIEELNPLEDNIELIDIYPKYNL